MRIVVLGGGVIGVTTAFYLAKAGHEVTLIERRSGPALETSFANAGEISPGYASPWAAPDVPAKALKWLFMEHAPLILKLGPSPSMLTWLLRMLLNCTPRAYARNKGRMLRLATYSRDQLIALRAETGISYDERSLGTLQLFRTSRQLDKVAKDVEVLTRAGVPCEVLDRKGCVQAEPGLAHSAETVVGGLRLPGDETGDCFKFTTSLAQLARGMGITFRFNESIKDLIAAPGGAVEAVRTDRGVVGADAFVVALGSYSAGVLKRVGLDVPVYPVKGYSITAPIGNADAAPVSTVLDESFKIAITRLGDRVRVGGMAEVSGFSTALPERRRRSLEHSVSGLFPGAADLRSASYWSGLRPMTPDGTPIVGPTPYSNLFLNTGHGTLGWTMACGSARVLADLMSGKQPEIPHEDLSVRRYRGRTFVDMDA